MPQMGKVSLNAVEAVLVTGDSCCIFPGIFAQEAAIHAFND